MWLLGTRYHSSPIPTLSDSYHLHPYCLLPPAAKLGALTPPPTPPPSVNTLLPVSHSRTVMIMGTDLDSITFTQSEKQSGSARDQATVPMGMTLALLSQFGQGPGHRTHGNDPGSALTVRPGTRPPSARDQATVPMGMTLALLSQFGQGPGHRTHGNDPGSALTVRPGTRPPSARDQATVPMGMTLALLSQFGQGPGHRTHGNDPGSALTVRPGTRPPSARDQATVPMGMTLALLSQFGQGPGHRTHGNDPGSALTVRPGTRPLSARDQATVPMGMTLALLSQFGQGPGHRTHGNDPGSALTVRPGTRPPSARDQATVPMGMTLALLSQFGQGPGHRTHGNDPGSALTHERLFIPGAPLLFDKFIKQPCGSGNSPVARGTALRLGEQPCGSGNSSNPPPSWSSTPAPFACGFSAHTSISKGRGSPLTRSTARSQVKNGGNTDTCWQSHAITVQEPSFRLPEPPILHQLKRKGHVVNLGRRENTAHLGQTWVTPGCEVEVVERDEVALQQAHQQHQLCDLQVQLVQVFVHEDTCSGSRIGAWKCITSATSRYTMATRFLEWTALEQEAAFGLMLEQEAAFGLTLCSSLNLGFSRDWGSSMLRSAFSSAGTLMQNMTAQHHLLEKGGTALEQQEEEEEKEEEFTEQGVFREQGQAGGLQRGVDGIPALLMEVVHCTERPEEPGTDQD
ncbi:hypothetical protein JZ751_014421, partial [Albula glossodonta]